MLDLSLVTTFGAPVLGSVDRVMEHRARRQPRREPPKSLEKEFVADVAIKSLFEATLASSGKERESTFHDLRRPPTPVSADHRADVQAGQPSRVGQHIDFGDLATDDDEAHDRGHPVRRDDDGTGRAVDTGRVYRTAPRVYRPASRATAPAPCSDRLPPGPKSPCSTTSGCGTATNPSKSPPRAAAKNASTS